MMKKILGLLTIVMLTLSLSACDMKESASRVGLELKQVRINDFSNKGFKAVVYLDVYNPNWYGLTITDLRYQALLADKEIARGAITGEIAIPRDGSVVAELPLDVSFAAFKGHVPDLIKIRADYQVRGEITFKTWFGRYTIPFDTQKERPPDGRPGGA